MCLYVTHVRKHTNWHKLHSRDAGVTFDYADGSRHTLTDVWQRGGRACTHLASSSIHPELKVPSYFLSEKVMQ